MTSEKPEVLTLINVFALIIVVLLSWVAFFSCMLCLHKFFTMPEWFFPVFRDATQKRVRQLRDVQERRIEENENLEDDISEGYGSNESESIA
uniref:Uncharacterized protein n=1 Tax=Caenorhabditis tropicalis TaxID=1561998 RepID=A0A1I7UPM3_9PELO